MEDRIHYRVINDAGPDTVSGIITLYREGGWWDSGSKPEIIPGMVKGSFIFITAVDVNGRITGMGRVISDGVSDAYIQDVVVMKEMRGKGIGGEIINTLTSLCIEKGILWIGLVAEPGTESFYGQFGFRPLAGHIPLRYLGNS